MLGYVWFHLPLAYESCEALHLIAIGTVGRHTVQLHRKFGESTAIPLVGSSETFCNPGDAAVPAACWRARRPRSQEPKQCSCRLEQYNK